MTRRGRIFGKLGLGLAALLVLTGCEGVGWGVSYSTGGLYYEDDLYWNDWYYGGNNVVIVNPDKPDRPDRPDRPDVKPVPPIATVPDRPRPPIGQPRPVRPPIHAPSGAGRLRR